MIVKKLLNYFFRGLLVFTPVALTIGVVVWAFTSLDRMFRDLLRVDIPGLGLAITLAIIFLIGILTSNFIGRKLVALIDRIFNKVPLIKMLYGSLKDLIEAFAGDKKKFDRPVVAQIAPGSSARVLGFITQDDLTNLGLKDYIAVYLPQSYNFAGNVVLFPRESVIPLDIPASEAMTFIVSGGVAG